MLRVEEKHAFLYTPLFCEENIWHLAKGFVAEGVDAATLQVLFISNPQRQVVLFNQRNGAGTGYVVWDYHVILRRHDAQGDRVYDFDSRLPFPCNSRDYLGATFGGQGELVESLRACLRVIPADEYLYCLYSDRSHMQAVVAEREFPPWPAITPAHDSVVRLDAYWDMQNEGIRHSRLFSVDSFIATEL